MNTRAWFTWYTIGMIILAAACAFAALAVYQKLWYLLPADAFTAICGLNIIWKADRA